MTQQYGPGQQPQNPQQAPYGYPPPEYPQQMQQPLQPIGYATPGGPAIDISEVAWRQRAVMWCLLGYIGLAIFYGATTASDPGKAHDETARLSLLVGVVAIAVIVTTAVFVFRLSTLLYEGGGGVVMGLGTLIPFVGLIFLLIVNGKATAMLRQHGISVGLMGANPKQIPPPGTLFAGQQPAQWQYPPPGYYPPPGQYPPNQYPPAQYPPPGQYPPQGQQQSPPQ